MQRNLRNLKHLLTAVIACLKYGFPARKLTVIGVTGTDGKTTTVNLIYHFFINTGIKAAMIGTTNAVINGKEVFKTLHTTTPDPMVIQKFIREAKQEDCSHLVLEVSSHAIDQHRVLGCNFKTAVLTNVTHEHLDYHETYENYLKTKLKLLKNAKIRVVNRDDASFPLLKNLISDIPKKNLTFSLKREADFRAENTDCQENKTTFDVRQPGGRIKSLETHLIGDFNVENILAAIAVAKEEGVKDDVIKESLLTFGGVPGRMERVKAGQSFKIIVDFALTPGAFSKVLPVIRKITNGRLIHVFGAAGDRDKTKRPILGQIAADFDDLIILTSDDTHREKLESIIPMLERGLKEKKWKKIETKEGFYPKSYLVIPDRKEALKYALGTATVKDTVFLSGMGHQTTMNIDGQEVSWNDKEEAKKIICQK